ncbi:MAG: hypothetical protein ACYCU8_00045 [Ferrimicrobium acidiphilum]
MPPFVQIVIDVIAGLAIASLIRNEVWRFVQRRRKPVMEARKALINAIVANLHSDSTEYDKNLKFFRAGRLPSRGDYLAREVRQEVEDGIQFILNQGLSDGEMWSAVFSEANDTRAAEVARALWTKIPSQHELSRVLVTILPWTMADIDANIHAPITRRLEGWPIYAAQWMRDRFAEEAAQRRLIKEVAGDKLWVLNR